LQHWVAAAVTVAACRAIAPPASRVEPLLEVVAAGDIALGPRATGDPLSPLPAIFGPVGALPRMRFANLESPITRGGSERNLDVEGRPTAGTIVLGAPAERAGWLRGRLDVVSLANNHALDQGEAGRLETASLLESQGVAVAWPGHDARVTAGGMAVTWMARDFSGAMVRDDDVEELVATVSGARGRGERVVVSVHWGVTGSVIASTAQQQLAHRLVDAGASAVVGHGPHVLQGVERRGRGVIAYSLGNLHFDCRCTDETDALVLGFTLRRDGAVQDAWVRPIHAGVAGSAPTLEADEELHDLVTDVSRELGTVLRRRGEVLMLPEAP
jgi:poly-gamma-glutamate synthesis protein (capsule biosynthesis protein)